MTRTPVVIAHLSPLKIIPWLMLWLPFVGLAFWIGWTEGDGYAFFVGGVGAFLAGTALYPLIFLGRRGLWIKDGELIYLAKWIVWTRADKVVSVNISRRRGWFASIVLRTTHQGPMSIPIVMLREPGPVIQARLREALGLTKAGDNPKKMPSAL